MKHKDNFLDFRIGDPVYDLTFGNGFVVNIIDSKVQVVFTDDWNEIDNENFDNPEFFTCLYSYSGKLTEISSKDFLCDTNYLELLNETYRSLYHGHNLTIRIDEKKPIRYKWANVYIDQNKEPFFVIYDTKDEAITNIKEGRNYVATIELKPTKDK